jgi:hypothetical protein
VAVLELDAVADLGDRGLEAVELLQRVAARPSASIVELSVPTLARGVTFSSR